MTMWNVQTLKMISVAFVMVMTHPALGGVTVNLDQISNLACVTSVVVMTMIVRSARRVIPGNASTGCEGFG